MSTDVERLRALLQPDQILHDCAGAGDCLFRSIAHRLWNDENRHSELRTLVASWYLRNAEDQYVKNMPHEWRDSDGDLCVTSSLATYAKAIGTAGI